MKIQESKFLTSNNMQVIGELKDVVIIQGVYDTKQWIRNRCSIALANIEKRKEEIVNGLWKYAEF